MKRIFYLLSAALILNACSKTEDLTPSPVAPLYQLPQGTAAYDDTIVAINKKYSTYILYKFSQVDYSYDYVSKLPDSAFNANPAYIPAALNLFKSEILEVYADSVLRKTLPIKVLLASYIGSGTSRSAVGFAASRSMLCIGWADSTLALKSTAELKQMRGKLHRYYIDRACQALAFSVPAEFIALCPKSYAGINVLNQYSEGILEPAASPVVLIKDFLGYIEYIAAHTETEMQEGVLSPQVDTKGLIKKKYQVVITHFKKIGIDLQAIGNKN